MAESRRQTRSTRRRGPQTDAQFWSNQPDQLMIERGQADAIQLVRSSINPTPGSTTTSEQMEVNATNTFSVPPMVSVDDEGLEEQFLTDEETANVLHTSANRVTTPVNTTPTNRSIQQTQDKELDLQPSRGPREGSIVNTIDQFLDENYGDVLRTSNIQTNFSLSASDRNLTGVPVGKTTPLFSPRCYFSKNLTPGGFILFKIFMKCETNPPVGITTHSIL